MAPTGKKLLVLALCVVEHPAEAKLVNDITEDSTIECILKRVSTLSTSREICVECAYLFLALAFEEQRNITAVRSLRPHQIGSQ